MFQEINLFYFKVSKRERKTCEKCTVILFIEIKSIS